MAKPEQADISSEQGRDFLTECALQVSKARVEYEERDELTVNDLRYGFVAIAHRGDVEQWICSVLFGSNPDGNVADRFAEVQSHYIPKEILENNRELENFELAGVGDRIMPMDEELKRIVARVHAVSKTLPAEVFIQELFRGQESSFATEVFGDSFGVQKTTPVKNTASKNIPHSNPTLAERTEHLKKRMRERVVGQDKAIDALASGYFRSELLQESGSPRGIFTFLGPPGVGKTLTAIRFGEVLSELEDGEHEFLQINMSDYAHRETFNNLIGHHQVYKNGKAGLLTSFVAKNPQSVIVFDEVEKAHRTTLNVLLALLDKGHLDDQFTESSVDFTRTWIIFTTNLGKELHEQANRMGFLSGTESSSEIFEALATTKTDDDAPALSSEFVSRLAKGSAVLFDKLNLKNYRLVLERRREKLEETLSRGCIRKFTLSLDQDSYLLFLLSLLPRLDARRAVTQFDAWILEILEDCSRVTSDSEIKNLRISVSGDETHVLKKSTERRISAVLVDDDKLMMREVDELFKEDDQADVKIFEPRLGDLTERIAGAKADMVLLDLETGEDEYDHVLEILSSIRETFRHLPVIVFQTLPEGKRRHDMTERLIEHGGARAFYSIPYGETGKYDEERFKKFGNHVMRKVRNIREERILRRFNRSRKSLRFSPVFNVSGDQAHVELTKLREETVYSSGDRSASITFSGIPPERFRDVIGLERAVARLKNVVKWLSEPQHLEALGAAVPRGYLFHGPPGTGKTLLARAVAGEADLPFISVGATELRAPRQGEGEARIRELFARARRYAPVIIFIDELDAIGADRGSRGGDTGILNQLLTTLDGCRKEKETIFVIATTNRLGALDPALIRPGRFDELIPIDLPNTKNRVKLFEHYFKKVSVDAAPDFDMLARSTSGMSPAAISQVTREAVYKAVSAGKDKVTQDHIEDALRETLYGAPLGGNILDDAEIHAVAVHEGGHALVSSVLNPNREIDYVTVRPRESGALGLVGRLNDDGSDAMTLAEVRNELAVMLAGRAAEKLLLGPENISAGVESDLEQASRLAARAVASWGFDDEYGMTAASVVVDSNELRQRVNEWIADAEKTATGIIEKHRERFDQLVELLKKYESLDSDDLRNHWRKEIDA